MKNFIQCSLGHIFALNALEMNVVYVMILIIPGAQNSINWDLSVSNARNSIV